MLLLELKILMDILRPSTINIEILKGLPPPSDHWKIEHQGRKQAFKSYFKKEEREDLSPNSLKLLKFSKNLLSISLF